MNENIKKAYQQVLTTGNTLPVVTMVVADEVKTGHVVKTPEARYFVELSQTQVERVAPLYHRVNEGRVKLVDSTDPADHFHIWANIAGKSRRLHLDAKSGRVKNWHDVGHLVKTKLHKNLAEVNLCDLELTATQHVRQYRRADGTLVREHNRSKDTRMVGSAYDKEGNHWHVWQATGNTGKFDQWEIRHPETGEHAPNGTLVGVHVGYEGQKLLGYQQLGTGRAAPIYDKESSWADKTSELIAFANNQDSLRDSVEEALLDTEFTKRKVCALIVAMIARHSFRVGSESGVTNLNKGKRDVEGNLLPPQLEQTFGATSLRVSHVHVSENYATFDFVGKSGKTWLKVETDARYTSLLAQLQQGKSEDEKLFTYIENGVQYAIESDDVRDFLRPFGFTPHRFRTYWASFLVYQTIQDEVSKNGAPSTKKEREGLLKKALDVAAEKLNDLAATVKLHYVLPQLVHDVLEMGQVVSGKLGVDLRPLELSGTESSWWLPYEQEFHDWLNEELLNSQPDSVNLSEVWLSFPELGPNDHWVTLKPHGPDSEDYHRVIIREHKDGSAHIVWSGNKGLLNLKLKAKRTEYEMNQAQSNKAPKEMTPEEKATHQQLREERSQQLNQTDEHFGQEILNKLGVEGDATSLIKALTSNRLKVQRSHAEIEESRQKREERIQQILAGDIPDDLPVAGLGSSVPIEHALAQAAVQDILGEMPRQLNGVSDELKQAWNVARHNPSLMREIAGLRAAHQEATRKIKKETKVSSSPGTVSVLNQLAFHSLPNEADLALLREAANQVTYQLHSRFWGEAHELSQGARTFFASGASDALNALSKKVTPGFKVNQVAIELLGHEVMAAAMAQSAATKGLDTKELAKSIEQLIAEKSNSTVAEALTDAETADEERVKIRDEAEAEMLTDAARVNALRNQTVRRTQSLAKAAGSLEAAAAVAAFLRTGVDDEVSIDAGDKAFDIQRRLEVLGLVEGEGYHLATKNNSPVIVIPKEGLPRLLDVARTITRQVEELGRIKSHTSVPKDVKDFSCPGMSDDITPKEQQVAVVQFLESEATNHKILANASVGIGKTILAGMAATRFRQKSDAPIWYILPTNLISTSLGELKEKFPGLTVEAAHTDFHPTAKTVEDRQKVYSAENKPDILLIGQDTIRQDAKVLAGLDESHRPGFIIGDEIQAMFTPGDGKEKQSQRSIGMSKIHAPYMLAMTGTVIRRSSVEVHRVLDWLKPGEFGSASNWALRYGKIGKGVSAFSNAIVDDFRKEIDNTVITETDKPNVELKTITRKIALSPTQIVAYRNEEEEYKKLLENPKTDRRRAAVAKVERQRKVVYGGEHDNNLLTQLKSDIEQFAVNGERGVIHAKQLKSVDAICRSFPPGTIIPYTGEDDIKRRGRIISAINDGTLITGGRVKNISTGVEGVVTRVDGQTATVKTDDGASQHHQVGDLESMVKAVCGTSTATGVLSTGLNLQKGSTWTVEYELADSAATQKQRIARNYRTGQTRDVTAITYVPDTPNTREQWHKLNDQRKLLDAVDDPEEYDDYGKLAMIE